MRANEKIEFIVNWINDYVNKSGAKGIIFGVSGGIDSAVISAIASKYYSDRHLALSMDIENSLDDIKDSRLVLSHFNLNYKIINLYETYRVLIKELKTDSKTFGNIKSRLRMITLYSFAQENNYLVIGTSNFNEIMTGYFTKYGDSGSDIIPLANLLKGDIVEIAKELGVPEKIINKKPTAGLYENQSDEDELGVSYAEMDSFFKNEECPIDKKEIIENLIKKSEHKRNISQSPLEIGKVLK